VAALAVQRDGELLLFDCGEGTQRQMMRFGVGFGVCHIFITHLHADHYLGLPGLLRTMSLQGRTESLVVWAPPGGDAVLREVVGLGGDRLLFPLGLRELPPGEAANFSGYRVEAFDTDHTVESIGLALIEDDRPGRFDVERARELGVPEGPMFGRLHRGESVELADGRVISPVEIVGAARPGRKLIYTGDTRPVDSTVRIAKGADLLIHEATFAEDERERALATRHSTARDAAGVAARAGARELVLTHLSARYSEQPHRLRREAAGCFPACTVAEDGMCLEVALRESRVEQPA